MLSLRELGFSLSESQAEEIRRGKDFVQLRDGAFDLDLDCGVQVGWISDAGQSARIPNERAHAVPSGEVVYDCRPQREPPLVEP